MPVQLLMKLKLEEGEDEVDIAREEQMVDDFSQEMSRAQVAMNGKEGQIRGIKRGIDGKRSSWSELMSKERC